MDKPKSDVTLRDIIDYDPETYLSTDEIETIKNTFAGSSGKTLLKILRKILLPTISDPELPVEEAGSDVWLAGTDWKQISNDQVKTIVLGRQEAIKLVIGGLVKLKLIIHNAPKSAEEIAGALHKNSGK